MTLVIYAWFFAIFASLFGKDSSNESLIILIISQQSEWDIKRADFLTELLLEQTNNETISVTVLKSSADFEATRGHWAIWPILTELAEKFATSPPKWLFICEPDTRIELKKLLPYLAGFDHLTMQFIGKGLSDKNPTIIHHYREAEDEKLSTFLYPDFASGFVLSWPLVIWLVTKVSGAQNNDFVIDPKHELSILINSAQVGLENAPNFCTTVHHDSCITTYQSASLDDCKYLINDTDVYFAVKTFSGFHKERSWYHIDIVTVVKRTWSKNAKNIEYFSDILDRHIPTVDMGRESVSKGHCAKTFAIFTRFLTRKQLQSFKWLLIADDDSLLSVPRLFALLQCYDSESTVILGERYGFQFSNSAKTGYDYPTGGAGMVFSRQAVKKLVENCHCSYIDAPDDMIIDKVNHILSALEGLCATSLQIPILHSAAFHQARPEDYPDDYIRQILPISFHKHWQVDPYKVYFEYLSEETSRIGAKIRQDL